MGKRIVIVEDDPFTTHLLSFILELEGYEIHTAKNGEEALDTIKNIMPDLILLDIIMPVMDGYNVLKKTKTDEKLKHIPVIMLTAKGQEWNIVKGFELGADDYMVKPFSPAELSVRIKKRIC